MLGKSNNGSLLFGTVVYLGANTLHAVIPFALLPILTRYLTPQEYGEVAMFQTLLGALAAFVGLSVRGTAVRKFYDDEVTSDELANYIGACLQILLCMSILVALGLGIFSPRISRWVGLDPKWVNLAIVATTANSIIQLRFGQWQVRKQAFKYGLFQISRSALDFVLSIGFVIILVMGAEGRNLAQVVGACVFASLSLYSLYRSRLLVVRCWRPDYFSEIFRFGLPLVPHVAGTFLLLAVDRFVISSMLGLEEAGIYMVAAQISMAFSLGFDALNKAFVPWLFERLKRNDMAEKVQIVRYTYCWFAFILCGALSFFFAGPILIKILAGAEYAAAGDVVGWLVLGQVFGGMYLMVTNYIFYARRTGRLAIVTITSGLFNFALLYLFVSYFGLQGAAYAFCISMGLRFLLTWCAAQKSFPMPWFMVKSARKDGRESLIE